MLYVRQLDSAGGSGDGEQKNIPMGEYMFGLFARFSGPFARYLAFSGRSVGGLAVLDRPIVPQAPPAPPPAPRLPPINQGLADDLLKRVQDYLDSERQIQGKPSMQLTGLCSAQRVKAAEIEAEALGVRRVA